jgi:hypothetical protein
MNSGGSCNVPFSISRGKGLARRGKSQVWLGSGTAGSLAWRKQSIRNSVKAEDLRGLGKWTWNLKRGE